MRVVQNDKPTYVRVSSVPVGGTFKHEGRFYIRPCAYVRDRVCAQGINLETGGYVSLDLNDLVEPVGLEVHEL